jgi:hypothetical protein
VNARTAGVGIDRAVFAHALFRGGAEMRARIIIEYPIPDGGDLIALRDREEQRWMRSETLLALPSATVKFEWVDEAKAS